MLVGDSGWVQLWTWAQTWISPWKCWRIVQNASLPTSRRGRGWIFHLMQHKSTKLHFQIKSCRATEYSKVRPKPWHWLTGFKVHLLATSSHQKPYNINPLDTTKTVNSRGWNPVQSLGGCRRWGKEQMLAACHSPGTILRYLTRNAQNPYRWPPWNNRTTRKNIGWGNMAM